jgi:hypothetical protein
MADIKGHFRPRETVNTPYSTSAAIALDHAGRLENGESVASVAVQRAALAPDVKLAVRDLAMCYANGHTTFRRRGRNRLPVADCNEPVSIPDSGVPVDHDVRAGDLR